MGQSFVNLFYLFIDLILFIGLSLNFVDHLLFIYGSHFIFDNQMYLCYIHCLTKSFNALIVIRNPLEVSSSCCFSEFFLAIVDSELLISVYI